MLATLGPQLCPATDVLSDNPADDPLGVLSLTRGWEHLWRGRLQYAGDSKMAALETRAFDSKREVPAFRERHNSLDLNQ